MAESADVSRSHGWEKSADANNSSSWWENQLEPGSLWEDRSPGVMVHERISLKRGLLGQWESEEGSVMS